MRLKTVDVITLFPELVQGCFAEGLTGKAIEQGFLSLHTVNPRQFSKDIHRSVDDRPYGGGPGMVMRCDVVEKSFIQIDKCRGRGYRVFLSPQGKTLNHDVLKTLSQQEHLVLLCGRYEGIDERAIIAHIDLCCSIGDYVLSGGELAAAVLIDGVVRLLPGVLGHQESADNDSFATGYLDCPHYTRPEVYNGESVPEVLLSGDHGHIDRYRRQQALGQSWIKRPDLFAKQTLSEDDLVLLNEFLQYTRETRE